MNAKNIIVAVALVAAPWVVDAARQNWEAKAARLGENSTPAVHTQMRTGKLVVEGEECAEKEVADVCKCAHELKTNRGMWVCNDCPNKDGLIDGKLWGAGCDLECPLDCQQGCDFSGNCIMPASCPPNCKHNGRCNREKKLPGCDTREEDNCLNKHGQCQACDQGWFGGMCKEQCPAECGDSPEGPCTRGGRCFTCKRKGQWGDKCENVCPKACETDCLIKDGMVDGVMMPAGSCASTCKNEKYGANCDIPCPENCDQSQKPVCTKGEGLCKKCIAGKWGKTCEQDCSKNCKNNMCRKDDGGCTEGCQDGFWGQEVNMVGDEEYTKDICDQVAPEHTKAPGKCAIDNGMPEECDDTWFPDYNAKTGDGECRGCPAYCKDSMCDKEGICTKDCEEGFWGPYCEKECPLGCDGGKDHGGPCTKDHGHCLSCPGPTEKSGQPVPGYSGPRCDFPCHPSCRTCTQYHGESKNKQPGNNKDDCLMCHNNQPAELGLTSKQKGPTTCDCIPKAEIGSEEICECIEPTGKGLELREAFFETKQVRGQENTKLCRTRCKGLYFGSTLKEVFDDSGDRNRAHCMRSATYKAIIMQYGTQDFENLKGAQGCEDNAYAITDKDGEMNCVEEPYVKYIMK